MDGDDSAAVRQADEREETHRIFGAEWLKGSYGAGRQPDQIFELAAGKGSEDLRAN